MTDLYTYLKVKQSIFRKAEDIILMAGNSFSSALHSHISSTNLSKPELKECESILSFYLENYQTRKFHKNPELFNALVKYLTNSDKRENQHMLNTLGLHLNYYTAEKNIKTYPQRLYHFQNRILFKNKSIAIDQSNSFKLYGRNKIDHTTVILPIENIFSDLISPNIYPLQFTDEYNLPLLKTTLDDSISLVNQFSPTLSQDLFKIINYIFLTPDFKDKIRYSYNLRTGYFGAFFINQHVTDRITLAESLIHEYIHQHLWMTWAFEFPDASLYDQIKIVSPFTMREKSISVMSHAYIIYAVIQDFQKHVLDKCVVSSFEEQHLVHSIKNATSSLPILRARLAEKIPVNSYLNNLLHFAPESINHVS